MPETSTNSPKQEDYAFDLASVYSSVVAVRTHIPDDAFTASILGTERGGNGVVISDTGLVLTIGYLVTEAETVWITDVHGRAVPGHVLGYDGVTGFGMVQALGKLDLPALPLGNSSEVSEGDDVIVVGFGGQSGSVSASVIAVREFAGYWEYLLDQAIFTAPAHPNWGGTGLIGRDGKLLGIGSLFIQQGANERDSTDGNMIVPIDLLKPIYEDMITTGSVKRSPRPWLGLFGTEVEDHVVVAGLSEDGPSHQAGLEVGDVVLEVDGQSVHSLADFLRTVWALGGAGVEVPLTIVRDEEALEARIESINRADLLKRPRVH
ncbi:MAG: serine protease [Rhodospirillaceae bacterium]|jgi:S1-C subfamily serine protease|nr:serine protease [Rhodospirillaceae bacterium]MBT6136956.1 serine protease [Rhodospirillaceae bacterium]